MTTLSSPPDSKFRLYHYWRSSCSWRVRWALALKGLPCEFRMISLLNDETDSPEYRAINSLGYVPTLEILQPVSPSKKSIFLAESVAILEWLEETYPTPALYPGNPLQRARIRQLVEIINSATQPLQNLNVTQLHSPNGEDQKKWNQHWIRQGLTAYQTGVRESAGKFSIGDTVTAADLCLIPQCSNAVRYEISLSEFPLLEKIYTAAMITPACHASAPQRFEPKC